MSNILRLAKELQRIKEDPDHSIYVSYEDHDVRNIRALLVGPAQTPYAFGFFEFALRFPADYPQHPPAALLLTTNNGQTRFNPNLYASGKVCLSILNTWRGEPWSPALGVSSCLTSMLSLLSDNPYANEPGHENTLDSAEALHYSQKVTHETIRISVLDRIERELGMRSDLKWEDDRARLSDADFASDVSHLQSTEEADTDGEPVPKRRATRASVERSSVSFGDLCKRLFLLYYDRYLEICSRESTNKKLHKSKFAIAVFEPHGNLMAGTFDYSSLQKRIVLVKEALDHETMVEWRQAFALANSQQQSGVHRIQRQFEQCVSHYRDVSGGLLDISLEEPDNYFAWDVVLFGAPMSSLDGGLVRIKFYIPAAFPHVQPRVRITTKLFHPNINSLGVPFLALSSSGEMKDQIEIITTFLQRDPEPDPSAQINNEASRLCFGTIEERKQYTRKFRRCVQDSMVDE